MKKYYVNKKADSDGDHEVHDEDCEWLPSKENREDLGEFGNCKDAVEKAKKTYPTADGCKHCSESCNEK